MVKFLNRSVISGCRGKLHPSELLQTGSRLLRQALYIGHLEGEVCVLQRYSRLWQLAGYRSLVLRGTRNLWFEQLLKACYSV